jgi:hypothetical protein
MEIKTELDTAYDFFVEAVAYRTQRTPAAIRVEIPRQAFLSKLETLHRQYLAGEFSIGRLADRMNVNPFQLDYLLTTLGMAVHN